MNKRYKRKKFYTPKFVEPHIRWDWCSMVWVYQMCSCGKISLWLLLCVPLSGRLRIEKHLRAKTKKANSERKSQAKLKERFPHIKVSATWNLKWAARIWGVFDSCEPDVCQAISSSTEGGLKTLSSVTSVQLLFDPINSATWTVFIHGMKPHFMYLVLCSAGLWV